mmetsp:Transcript_147127/g.208660  ORF Transcript_147127/g.208660 Transcript_147127/m.208660 type:complete len:97 (+) Transcript_147127:975-1265(+)
MCVAACVLVEGARMHLDGSGSERVTASWMRTAAVVGCGCVRAGSGFLGLSRRCVGGDPASCHGVDLHMCVCKVGGRCRTYGTLPFLFVSPLRCTPR